MKHEPGSRPFRTPLTIARWLEKLRRFFLLQPHTETELIDLLRDAKTRHLLDTEALHIMEGALSANNTQVDEIMVPRPQMIALKYGQSPENLLKVIIESGHSRFPVVGESIDDIKGILLAKRLLPSLLKQMAPFDITQVMHPVHMVPEKKRIIDLLREFREQRYHMAIVVDEYGGVSGLVTIEDVLEEIVGDIEDETDEDEDDQFIRKLNPRDYLVKALTPISDFNQHFNASLSDEEYDTIGGLLTKQFGHLPRRNEMTSLDNFRFRVLNADSRQVHLLRMTIPAPYGKDSEIES
jgi:magnesium and cobalt transporter